MSNSKTALQFTVVFFSTILVFFFLFISPTYSQTAEELENIINQKEEELNKQKSYLSEIEKRIKEISGSNYSLTEKVNLLNVEITKLQTEIDKRNTEIEEKLRIIAEKEALLQKKKESLDLVSSQLYMKSRYNEGQLFFSFSNLEEMLQTIFVKKSAIDILKEDIEEITGEFVNLVELKESLEKEKQDLDTQKQDLDKSYQLVLAEKKKVQAELNAQVATKGSVTRKINGLTAELSDLQYQLIVTRQGGTYVNPDSVPSNADYNSSLAGFMANAPSGSFGVFSIGAYTHRNGMSQWGARARANAGQNYEQILMAYYPGRAFRTNTVVISGVSENIMTNISTTTYGTLNFEDDYLLRLNEVPESWPMEVLKAQAIAARTYAINYTQNGRKSICTTESCQVVGAGQKTGAWKTAVQATRGMILTDGAGSPFSTQYAAVHGGWSNTAGWDTTDKTGNGDWMSRAWDRLSGVSWFYKMWYRTGYSESSSTCGRTSWLSQAEMSDIINAYQVWVAHNRSDSRILPIFDACHSSGNPYTHAELRSLASRPVTSISSVIVSSSNGTTSSVSFYTNAGTFIIPANDFKTIYNLRAPGYLRIPQTGFIHINVHKK
ncbi:MAG TPA: SpoIID/LytB domain-containing protein [Candidatus Dojkabacteria bacterium]|nr:SpoIID/LytB domain-containing protein [Candidatus Dojkabacteria bacterium]